MNGNLSTAAVDFEAGTLHKDYSYISKLNNARQLSAGIGLSVLLHCQNGQWDDLGSGSISFSHKTSGYDSDTSIISGCSQ